MKSQRLVALLLLCSMSLQGCSTRLVNTSVTPGVELSRTVLEKRETANTVAISELEPYKVKPVKKVCNADFVQAKYQAVENNTYEKCYVSPIAPIGYPFCIYVSLGTLFIYDLFTGFSFFRKGFITCSEGGSDTKVTENTVANEFIDNNSAQCQEEIIPNADIFLTANAQEFKLKSTENGVATFDLRQIAGIENRLEDLILNYRYDTAELTTRLTPRQIEALLHPERKPKLELIGKAQFKGAGKDGKICTGSEGEYLVTVVNQGTGTAWGSTLSLATDKKKITSEKNESLGDIKTGDRRTVRIPVTIDDGASGGPVKYHAVLAAEELSPIKTDLPEILVKKCQKLPEGMSSFQKTEPADANDPTTYLNK